MHCALLLAWLAIVGGQVNNTPQYIYTTYPLDPNLDEIIAGLNRRASYFIGPNSDAYFDVNGVTGWEFSTETPDIRTWALDDTIGIDPNQPENNYTYTATLLNLPPPGRGYFEDPTACSFVRLRRLQGGEGFSLGISFRPVSEREGVYPTGPEVERVIADLVHTDFITNERKRVANIRFKPYTSPIQLIFEFIGYARNGSSKSFNITFDTPPRNLEAEFGENKDFDYTVVMTVYPNMEMDVSIAGEANARRSPSFLEEWPGDFLFDLPRPVSYLQDMELWVGYYQPVDPEQERNWYRCPMLLTTVAFIQDAGPWTPSYSNSLESTEFFPYAFQKRYVNDTGPPEETPDGVDDLLPPAPSDSNTSRNRLIILVVADVGGFLLLLVIVTLIIVHRRRARLAQVADKLAPVNYEVPALFRDLVDGNADKGDTQSAAGAMLPLDFLPEEAELTPELCLASGFFGQVYVFKARQEDGRLYALKIFDLGSKAATTMITVDYLKEVQILSKIRHPHIVEYIGHSLYPSGKPALLMAFEEGLSLSDHLYPTITLVVPQSDLLPVFQSYLAAVQQGAEQIWTTQGHISNFTYVKFGEAVLTDTSPLGRRQLEQAAFGSRVTIDPNFLADLRSNPAALSIGQPVFVVSHGARVHLWPVDWAIFSLPPDQAPSMLLQFVLAGLGTLPPLSCYRRMRTAVKSWEAIHWLHKRKPVIVHSDIKPQNILLSRDMEAKVADVGLAQEIHMPSQMSYVMHAHGLGGGTVGYKDPALNDARPRFGEKNDVYSFGVVILELFPQWYAGPAEIMLRLSSILVASLSAWEQRISSTQLLDALRETFHIASQLYPEEHEQALALEALRAEPSQRTDDTGVTSPQSTSSSTITLSDLSSLSSIASTKGTISMSDATDIAKSKPELIKALSRPRE